MPTSSADDYDLVAPYYDALTASLPDTHDAVEFLSELAGENRVLELGVGTGRIACPLADRGHDVTGLDNSPGMLAQLRARPDGANVEVVLGSFVDPPVEGKFPLVLALFNTYFSVTTQEEQLAAFRSAKEIVTDDGLLVVETSVPDVARADSQGRTLNTGGVERDRVFLEAATHDPARQHVRSQTMVLTADGIQMFPLLLRYIWPSELTLMAELAGFTLVRRFGDWTRGSYSKESSRQISIFAHQGATPPRLPGDQPDE